jgi:hypothetical protein
MSERRYITPDEAISLLPDGDEIHTFIDSGCLIGADWSREEIIDKISSSDVREITGPAARGMGHGLVVYNKSAKYQSDLLFIETDKARLDAFDPAGEAE